MITWLGAPVLRTTRRRGPALREPPSRYSFSLVRVLPDCRELVAWSEGPLFLTRAQADARWAEIIPRVTGVGGHPGEGLELRMLRGSVVVNTRVFVGRPAACTGSIGWLGQDLTPSGLVACGPGRQGHWDPVARAVVCRDIPVAGGSIELRHGCYPRAIGPGGQCVPFQCPEGTVRNTDSGECIPPLPPPGPAPGECTDAQQVLLAQPCFYVNQTTGVYEGPLNLLQGASPEDVARFCVATRQAGYFDLPLCDPDTLPAPPSCITPEQRLVLTSCTENGYTGSDPVANYFCWVGLKVPALLQEWIDTQDCPPGQAPVPEQPVPGQIPVPGAEPAPVAKKSSAVVPLLIGAAVVGAAVYYFS